VAWPVVERVLGRRERGRKRETGETQQAMESRELRDGPCGFVPFACLSTSVLLLLLPFSRPFACELRWPMDGPEKQHNANLIT
jgi:hypothetical protein